jgi:glycosyltransferase involved in cell wall biosynthesis
MYSVIPTNINTPETSLQSKTKKILFIIDTLQFGGAEQSLLANASRFKNIEPIVCHIYPGEVLKPKFIEKGIKVYSLNVLKLYGFKTAYNRLAEVVKQERPDLMVAYLTRSEIVSRLVAKFNKIPIVGTFVQDLYAKDYNSHLSWMAKRKVWFFKQLNKFTSSVCVGFVANSQIIKETNSKQLSIPQFKIKVINRGRESAQITCRDFTKKKEQVAIRFLNVSRLYHVKGQTDLILGFKKFADKYPFCELHIVGEGPMREKLEQLIKECELEDKVTLLGARNDVPALLATYDCFVFPTHVEGFSGALVEAMFAGLPILASDIQQNKEAVTHMDTGYLFKTGSIEEIEKAFVWFKDNEQFASTIMAKKAHVAAKQNFELQNIVAEFENYLLNIITPQN